MSYLLPTPPFVGNQQPWVAPDSFASNPSFGIGQTRSPLSSHRLGMFRYEQQLWSLPRSMQNTKQINGNTITSLIEDPTQFFANFPLYGRTLEQDAMEIMASTEDSYASAGALSALFQQYKSYFINRNILEPQRFDSGGSASYMRTLVDLPQTHALEAFRTSDISKSVLDLHLQTVKEKRLQLANVVCDGHRSVLSPLCSMACLNTTFTSAASVESYLSKAKQATGVTISKNDSGNPVLELSYSPATPNGLARVTAAADKYARANARSNACRVENAQNVSTACAQCDANAIQFCNSTSTDDPRFQSILDASVIKRCSCIKGMAVKNLQGLLKDLYNSTSSVVSAPYLLIPCFDGGMCLENGFLTDQAIQSAAQCSSSSLCSNVFNVATSSDVNVVGNVQKCVVNINNTVQQRVFSQHQSSYPPISSINTPVTDNTNNTPTPPSSSISWWKTRHYQLIILVVAVIVVILGIIFATQ